MNQGCKSGPFFQLCNIIQLFGYLSIGLDPDETLNGDRGPISEPGPVLSQSAGGLILQLY